MAVFQFRDADGQPMDALYEFSHERHLLMHSRGGAIGTKNARNTKYGQALRILLKRTRQSRLEMQEVWVDSTRVQKLPLSARRIYTDEDAHLTPEKLYSLLTKRMAKVGRDSENQRYGGNRTKRLRFRFAGPPSEAKMIRVLGWGWHREDNVDNLIPAEELERVTPELIWQAVKDLLSNDVNHGFGKSTTYHVICPGGVRLSPKPVFGLAASKAFGFNLLPENFRGGKNTPCFRAITEAGYKISSKDAFHPTSHLPISADDQEWTEGRKRRVTHLARERASGLAAKKKADFARKNKGRLFCERCELDPVATYGEGIGAACIEVHHKTPLSELREGQHTKLSDLECLCANCHRMVHYKLRHPT